MIAILLGSYLELETTNLFANSIKLKIIEFTTNITALLPDYISSSSAMQIFNMNIQDITTDLSQ